MDVESDFKMFIVCGPYHRHKNRPVRQIKLISHKFGSPWNGGFNTLSGDGSSDPL